MGASCFEVFVSKQWLPSCFEAYFALTTLTALRLILKTMVVSLFEALEFRALFTIMISALKLAV